METNLSVWDYHNKDDSKFIDPLYLPYQKTLIRNHDGQMCPYNPFLKQGEYYDPKNPSPTAKIHRESVKKGKGMTFQLEFPGLMQCPSGFFKDEKGFCHQKEMHIQPIFYSNEAPGRKYHYFNGYTKNPKDIGFIPADINDNGNRRLTNRIPDPACNAKTPGKCKLSEFDFKSENPHTGNYNLNARGVSTLNHKYGLLATKDSYLA